ncbi:hypothetical protein B0A55_02508 [Friedmanniomyces simplex]|uniref:Uncharacterized protein n=1 Tax=Friedmanniomyces simplex TaxID=329884 RepID=A0A4U0XNX3_9PEZI|nr:hypothetical protein B0A55_02508 [Friedmanniomyces simplex]
MSSSTWNAAALPNPMQPPPSRFFELPRELRDIIYQLALAGNEGIQFSPRGVPSHALLGTSRQSRDELLAALIRFTPQPLVHRPPTPAGQLQRTLGANLLAAMQGSLRTALHDSPRARAYGKIRMFLMLYGCGIGFMAMVY